MIIEMTASTRKAVINSIFQSIYECAYCETTFKTESRFMQHRCKEMIKAEEFKTITGQNAWSFYQKWMLAQHKTVSNPASFMKSRHYNAFIKFASFVKKIGLADVDVFIQMMKDKSIQPTLWTNDQMYSLYLEYMDRNTTPTKQANLTMKTLSKIADDLDCDISEVFNVAHPTDILETIRSRKLSPWILLRSVKFRAMLERISDEERNLFEHLIRPSYWSAKFQLNPDIVKKMSAYVKEMNL
jgi:hypothetical protein